MTAIHGDDRLAGELRGRLIGEGLTDGVNLLVQVQDGVVRVHLMAVDLGRLGMLLAAMSDPAELPVALRTDRRAVPPQQRDSLFRADPVAVQRCARGLVPPQLAVPGSKEE